MFCSCKEKNGRKSYSAFGKIAKFSGGNKVNKYQKRRTPKIIGFLGFSRFLTDCPI